MRETSNYSLHGVESRDTLTLCNVESCGVWGRSRRTIQTAGTRTERLISTSGTQLTTGAQNRVVRTIRTLHC